MSVASCKRAVKESLAAAHIVDPLVKNMRTEASRASESSFSPLVELHVFELLRAGLLGLAGLEVAETLEPGGEGGREEGRERG